MRYSGKINDDSRRNESIRDRKKNKTIIYAQLMLFGI